MMTNPTTVPRIRTPLADADLRDKLISVYTALYDEPPSERRLALLFCQLAFEHGAGADTRAPADGRACWNCYDNDLGNRRGIAGDVGAFYMTAGEIIDGHEKPVGGIWPAYSTSEEGLRTWLLMLASRYKTAWVASLSGGTWVYAVGLKAGGYYTTNVSRYNQGLATWMRLYVRRWPFTP